MLVCEVTAVLFEVLLDELVGVGEEGGEGLDG